MSYQYLITYTIIPTFSVINNHSYKPIKIPGEPGLKLKKCITSVSPSDINNYQKQIGSLLDLALKYRPDITFAAIYCAR
jgi:hypothetical protein